MKDKLDNDMGKIKGKVKEAIGSLTDNEELELKGKLQGAKAEIGDKWGEFKEDVADIKDEVLEKANDLIDKVKANKR